LLSTRIINDTDKQDFFTIKTKKNTKTFYCDVVGAVQMWLLIGGSCSLMQGVLFQGIMSSGIRSAIGCGDEAKIMCWRWQSVPAVLHVLSQCDRQPAIE